MKGHTRLVFYLDPLSSCQAIKCQAGGRHAVWQQAPGSLGVCLSDMLGLQTVTVTPRWCATWLSHKPKHWEVDKGLESCFFVSASLTTIVRRRRRLSQWWQSISLWLLMSYECRFSFSLDQFCCLLYVCICLRRLARHYRTNNWTKTKLKYLLEHNLSKEEVTIFLNDV